MTPMNMPEQSPQPRRQPKRLLWEAAFVAITLVACFVAFVYWYQSKMASYSGSN
jgi:hypothetical protein